MQVEGETSSYLILTQKSPRVDVFGHGRSLIALGDSVLI